VPDFYAANAEFKDPFNEVRGTEAIARIFRHMFTQVDEPRFKIGSRFGGEGDERRRDAAVGLPLPHPRPAAAGDPNVRGASHLRFDAAGKVVLHRDYWDAAEELYAKLPVLGGLMRYLQRMGRA
jgi:steroid delta-isomerase